MATKRQLVLALGLLALAEGAAAEDRAGRFRLILNGSYDSESLTYSTTRSFTEFVESGSNTGKFSVGSGIGFDGGVQFNVLTHVGIMASVTRYARDQTGAYEAALPHPLYLNQPRRVSGDLPAASYTETAGHFDVVLTGNAGRFDVSGWGGVSVFQIEGRLLSSIQYRHSYPYDAVTITGTPTSPAKDKPKGWNVGAGLDFRVVKHVALGAQVRYSQAKAKLAAGGLETAEFDAGGFQVGGGIRLVF